MNIVIEAIQQSGLKTQEAFAEAISRSQSYVAKCVAQKRFPIAVLKDVERVSGIPRHILDPEFFEGYEPTHVTYPNKIDKESLPND